jgi:hypothetical protein
MRPHQFNEADLARGHSFSRHLGGTGKAAGGEMQLLV